jgi:hypothetical protein
VSNGVNILNEHARTAKPKQVAGISARDQQARIINRQSRSKTVSITLQRALVVYQLEGVLSGYRDKGAQENPVNGRVVLGATERTGGAQR